MSLLKRFFGQESSPHSDITTPLDLVNYAASLASNPSDIDHTLDAVRLITSQLQPGQAPDAQDGDKLLSVYVQLEAYLTTKEPIRAFTKQDLRKRLTPQLLQQLQNFEAENAKLANKTNKA